MMTRYTGNYILVYRKKSRLEFLFELHQIFGKSIVEKSGVYCISINVYDCN